MKHLFSVLLCLCFLSISITAQEGFNPDTWVKENNLIPPSPEAAALGRYGDIPINYYTGSPNISFPLHTVGGRYINLPIGLSYDLSSVRVSTVPTWVGMGWSLSAGGVITRSAIGAPDVESNYYGKLTFTSEHNSQPYNIESHFLDGLIPQYPEIKDQEFYQAVTDGYIEIQPDVYNFNIPGGYSGSFIIQRNKEVFYKEHTDLIIVPQWGGSTLNKLVGFEITTPQGTKYVYDAVESSKYTVINDTDGNTGDPSPKEYNSSWFLTSIESLDHSEKIHIYYLPVNQVDGPDGYTQPLNHLIDDSKTYPAAGSDPECSHSASATGSTSLGLNGTSIIYGRKYVDYITFEIGNELIEEVHFSSSEPEDWRPSKTAYGDRQLDRIQVKKRWKQGSLVNTNFFDFNYDDSIGRLTLKSVQEKGYKNGTIDEKPAYSFGYVAGTLPDKTVAGMDHWGYFKSNYVTTLIPTINGIGNGADRTSSSLQYGALNSITYPTGGSTAFEYEGHTISDEDQYGSETLSLLGGHKVGGLRLKKIIDYPGSGLPITRSFEYLNHNNSSSGRFLQRGLEYTKTTTFDQIRPPGLACFPGTNICDDYKCMSVTVFAQDQSDPRTISSNHIGYSRVIETIGDENGNIGRNVYRFHNDFLSSADAELWENKNGTLDTLQVFNESDDLVKQTVYNYSFLSGSGCPGNRCKTTYAGRVSSDTYQSTLTVLCDDNTPSIWVHPMGNTCSSGKPFSSRNKMRHKRIDQLWKRLDSEVTTEYFYENGLQTVQSTKAYQYNDTNVNQPTYTSFTNSDGAVHATEIQFRNTTYQGKGLPERVLKKVGGSFIGGIRYVYTNGRVVRVHELFQGDNETDDGLQRVVLTYDGNGRPQNYTHMNFPTETYTYENGLLTKREKADWTWEYDYNERRLMTSQTDIDGQEVTYDHDGVLRLTDITARGGNIATTIAYQLGGANSITQTTVYSDAPTNSITRNFDGLGRPISTIHNGVKKEEYIYDQYGRLFQETYLPGSLSTHEYDESPLQRRLKTTYPDDEFISFVYDAELNMYKNTTFDEKGNPTITFTEIIGRTNKVKNALNGLTQYTYEDRGHLINVSPPAGSPYIYKYDNRNRLTSKKIPGQEQSHIFRYDDANDLMEFSIDPNGNRMDYTYDQYGREKLVKLAELGTSFDDLSQGTWGSAGDIVIQNQYAEDEASSSLIQTGKMLWTEARLILPSGLGDFTKTTYSYDAFGRVQNQAELYPLGNQMKNDILNFTYNHADWVMNEKIIHNGYYPINAINTGRNYDSFGREISRLFGANLGDAMSWSMTYNDRDEMTSKKLGSAGTFFLDKIDYKYHIRGWLTHMNDIIHEEGEAEFCEDSTIDENPNQVETTIGLDELLDLIVSGEDIDIEQLDECTDVNPPSDCFEELADRTTTLSLIEPIILGDDDLPPFGIEITAISMDGIDIPLPNSSYLFSFDVDTPPLSPSLDDSQLLETHLGAWLLQNGYAFDNVKVEFIIGEPVSLTVKITIEQTEAPFHQVDYKRIYPDHQSTVLGRFLKSNEKLVPCDEVPPLGVGETAGGFPTSLYKIQKSETQPYWSFKEDLYAETGYKRTQRIDVYSPAQQFLVSAGEGNSATVNAVTLKEMMEQNTISNIEPVQSPADCELTPLVCSETEIAQQNQSLDEIMNQMAAIDPFTLEGPVELYVVKLCDGSVTYILGDDLLNQLQGNYVVLDQMTIIKPFAIQFDVVIDLKRPIFAMEFSHEANGNISNMKWKVTDHTAKYYDHTYDELNRLIGSAYGQIIKQDANSAPYEDNNNHFTVFGIDYDPIGNINTLSRYGMKPNGNCFDTGIIDDLTYTYNNDRLTRMRDDAPSAFKEFGFKPKAGAENSDYQYDKNGNMIFDPHKGLTIEYNHLNLPKQITGNGGQIQIIYDAAGRKWKKVSIEGANTITKEYAFGIEYENQKIEAIYSGEGRLVPNFDASGALIESYRAEYWRQDHLGNTRLAFSDFNGNGIIEFKDDPNTPEDDTEIVQENHYYPFGLNQIGDWYATTAPENKYQYNGKELNEELGLNWNDYGARYYDPAIARWNAIDPLADNYLSFSTFGYALNNPIKFVDPDGMRVSLFDRMESLGAYHGITSEEAKARDESPSTLDAYVVNTSKSGLNLDQVLAALVETSSILERNGITEINYHIKDEKSMQSLPSIFRYDDRSLFLGLTNNSFNSIGASAIHGYLGHVDTYDSKGPISGIDVGEIGGRIDNQPPDSYELGYIIAHEFAHQLDAFALMSMNGNLDGRGFQGHYDGREVNLLMNGQRKTKAMKKGGDHELLLPEIRQRILQYYNN